MQTHHLQYYASGKHVHKKPVVEFYLQPALCYVKNIIVCLGVVVVCLKDPVRVLFVLVPPDALLHDGR